MEDSLILPTNLPGMSREELWVEKSAASAAGLGRWH